MTKHTIIHISDIHISINNLNSIRELRTALVKDIKQNTHNTVIDMVVCSGDLVFSGTEDNFELAIFEFVEPLLSELKIPYESFIYVPGNHEIDIKQVDPDFHVQFTNRILASGIETKDLFNRNVVERLNEFYNCSELFNKFDKNKLVITKIIKINEINYGISFVNTAWNSAGDSKNEIKKILISREDLVTSIKEIENCDKKIIVMHHPLDWFDDDNASEIELLLGKYDLVLTGHKHHENSCEVSNVNGKTIINAASKLDVSNGENGYSIIQFDNETNKLLIKSRCYVKTRLSYAPNIRISDDGTFITDIKTQNYEQQLLCDVILHTRRNLFSAMNNLFIANLLETSEMKNFEDLFVEPIIGRCSELVKEQYDDVDNEKINIFEEIEKNSFTTFWGRKEAGKTILAHYIAKYYYNNYAQKHLIPVIIDCRFLDTYKTAIVNKIRTTLNDLSDDDFSISKNEIEKLCLNNSFLIIMDNFDNTNKQMEQLQTFKNLYPNNKFIFFRHEMQAVFSDENKSTLVQSIKNDSHVNLYIRTMDKHNIRLLAKNMSAINPAIEDAYVNRVIYSFSTNNMPRTPFAVSLILAICNETSDYMPTNQAKIVENFMEKLLEKLNPQEVFSKTYDFNNKEKFLAELAYEIFNSKSYFITEQEFNNFTIEYHNKKAYEIKDSKFDKLFFDKGILSCYDGKVFFRYECLNHYYLSKYCLFNQKFFNDEILTNNNYLNYVDVISYYSGLNREDKSLLLTLIDYAKPYIETQTKVVNLLEFDSIKLQLNIAEEEVREMIANTKQLPTEEKDKLTDMPDNSKNYNPIGLKENIEYNENEAFSILIELLGKVLRSSEELDAEIKKEGFNIFINGCIILWQKFRESLLNFAQKINEDIISKRLTEGESDWAEIKHKLDKAYNIYCDIIKLSVPLALTSFIFDSVGTDKMKKIFLEAYEKLSKDSPEKLLILLLICDLKMSNWNQILNNYIKMISKKDYHWILFFKCQYYLQFNYFNNDTPKIIEPMADCFIVANNSNKMNKSKIIGKIKSKNILMPFKKAE